MKKPALTSKGNYRVGLIPAIIIVIIMNSCSSVKPLTRASYFRFSLEDESYRIRSVRSAEEGNSYNELIGKDFVATDFDQDGIIDKIVLGNTDLGKSQQIYTYGLDLLVEKKQLKYCTVETIDYLQENSEYDYQIKSFIPDGDEPFNEFKIIRKHELADTEVIILDRKADGILDDVLAGPANEIDDVQERYTYVLNTGLEKKRLIKEGTSILVRAK